MFFDLNQRDKIWTLAVFAVCLGVYLLTLGTGPGFEDHAEFQAAAVGLGVPHAHGYPLLCLVGKLFTFLPFGSVAWQVNAANAVFSALACSLLFILCRRLYTERIWSLFAVGCLAFSETWWSQSVMVEAYTMAVFFFLLSLYFLTLLWDKVSSKVVFALGMVSSLGVLAHYLNLPVFVLSLLGLAFCLYRQKSWQLKFLIALVAGVVVGLLPILYLPLAASGDPLVNAGNVDKLENLFAHLLRLQFNSLEFQKSITTGDRFSFLGQVGVEIYDQFFHLTLFMLVGAVVLIRSRLVVAVFILMVATGLSVGVVMTLKFPAQPLYFEITRTYYLHSFAMLCLVLPAAGIWLESKVNGIGVRMGALILGPLVLLGVNYNAVDRSDYKLGINHARNIFLTLEENALLITTSIVENEFPLAYLVQTENPRPDVNIVSQSGNVFHNPYGDFHAMWENGTLESRRTEVEWNLIRESDRPVYYDKRDGIPVPPGYKLVQKGILYKVVPDTLDMDQSWADIWNQYQLDYDPDALDFFSRAVVANYKFYQGKYLYDLGSLEAAYEKFDEAIGINPVLEAAYNNQCVIHINQKRFDEAEGKCKKSLGINREYLPVYRNLAIIFINRGQFPAAASILKEGLVIGPDHLPFLLLLGDLSFEHLKDKGQAQMYWSLFLQNAPPFHPEVPRLKQNLEILKANN